MTRSFFEDCFRPKHADLLHLEYNHRVLTKLAGGNAYRGCYILAVTIFSIGIFRDIL